LRQTKAARRLPRLAMKKKDAEKKYLTDERCMMNVEDSRNLKMHRLPNLPGSQQ
jgi:hypothetical protein